MRKNHRILSILCLSLFLGLPLAAQSRREPAVPCLGFLSALWERLTASTSRVTALWEEDGDSTSATTGTTPPPGGVGKGLWDPNG